MTREHLLAFYTADSGYGAGCDEYSPPMLPMEPDGYGAGVFRTGGMSSGDGTGAGMGDGQGSSHDGSGGHGNGEAISYRVPGKATDSILSGYGYGTDHGCGSQDSYDTPWVQAEWYNRRDLR